jgi:asparagine synthase (glutamine-hydrolysing)
MAVSLETRVPLLNREVMEFLADTPLSLKLRGFTRKWLLREAMAGQLPDDIINRPKKGFGIPVARWLTSDLRQMTQDYLSPVRLERQGIFNPTAVSKILAEHLERRRNNHKMLWTLLMFQLWWDNWMEPG